MKKFVLFNVALLLSTVLSSGAYAFELKPEEIRGQETKAKVSVLQNRFFLKKMRPEVGVFAGKLMNEAYTDSTVYGARIGMFFNEWVGAEFQYFKVNYEDSDDRKALYRIKYRHLTEDKEVSPDVEMNPISGGMDINAVAAPFYGKLNFLDKYIVYSDLYVTAGMSKVKTDVQGDKTAFLIGAGMRVYMFESLSFRLDFRDRVFKQKTNEGKSNSTKHSLNIDFGVSYFFL